MQTILAAGILALATAAIAQDVEPSYAVTKECADAGIKDGLQCQLCGPYPPQGYEECQAYRGTFDNLPKGYGSLSWNNIFPYDPSQNNTFDNPAFYPQSGINLGYMSGDNQGSAAFPVVNQPVKINKTTTFYGTGLGQILGFYYGCEANSAPGGTGASPCTLTVRTAYNKDGFERAGEAQFLFNYYPSEQYHRQRITKQRLQFVDTSKLFPLQSYNYTFEVGGFGYPALSIDSVIIRTDLRSVPKEV